MDIWHTMDNIISNITAQRISVKSIITEGLRSVAVDGTTITGDGTPGNPLVSSGGGGGGAVDSVNGHTGVVLLNTGDISSVSDLRYVTDAQLVVLGNTSGTNTGDNATNSQYSGLATSKEDAANKSTSVVTDQASNTKYPSVKAVYDWVISLGYITASALTNYLQKNVAITGATKTKITYDANGLVTSGADATTADIADSTDKRYVTDAQLVVVGNTSGTNTGDNATNLQYSGLVSNATHTGEVTGATALTVDKTAISNKTAATIVGTDYVLFGDTSDSNNLKKGLVSDIVALVSGTALNSITAASAVNTIDNGNFQQEWRWNSLQSNTGLKISSSSGGLLNTQNRLFECELTGIMAGTGNSSYAGYFRNTQTLGNNFGIYAEGVTSAIQSNGSINITSGALQLGGSSGALFYRLSGNTYLQASNSQGLVLESGNGVNYLRGGTDENMFVASRKTLNQRYVLGIGGSAYQSSNYISAYTTATVIERDLGKLIFSANTGLAGGFASFTPNNVMTINGGATEATSNVGIGTTSPVASAKLEVSSTKSGFLPPRMTATQASAISSPAKGLILYATDTNGTFTSAGLWMYNGTIWKLILAE